MDNRKKEFDVICIGQIVQDILVTNIPENALTSEKDTFLADEILMSSGGTRSTRRRCWPNSATGALF